MWVQFLKKGERGHAMDVTVESERVRGVMVVYGGMVDKVRSSSERCC